MPYGSFEKFYEIGVIPVLEIDAVKRAVPLAKSLLSEYLQNQKIHTVGGSWMAKRAMIADGQFTEITRMAKEASTIVKQIRRNNL